jgi:hypothetical protein
MATLPIIIPSPSSGFHSSYYLGLGWGLAEVTWGIVQGWEQMSLYEDVMTQELDEGLDESKFEGLGLLSGEDGDAEAERSHDTIYSMDEVARQEEEEAELERKVEALERMRGRRGESTYRLKMKISSTDRKTSRKSLAFRSQYVRDNHALPPAH